MLAKLWWSRQSGLVQTDLHLAKNAVAFHSLANVGGREDHAADGGLHEQLLEHGIHVAGCPTILQPGERSRSPADCTSLHAEVIPGCDACPQHGRPGVSCST